MGLLHVKMCPGNHKTVADDESHSKIGSRMIWVVSEEMIRR